MLRCMLHKYQRSLKSTLKIITPTMKLLRKQLHYIHRIKIKKDIFLKNMHGNGAQGTMCLD